MYTLQFFDVLVILLRVFGFSLIFMSENFLDVLFTLNIRNMFVTF